MNKALEQNPSLPCPSSQLENDQIAALVTAAQGGDRGAMERLLEHYQDRVWRRALYRLGNHDEAWEVAQEVFIICFRKIGQFRGEAQFWTWLGKIVDNQVKNRLGWWKRRGRNRTLSLDEIWPQCEEEGGEAWQPPDPSPSPRQQASARQQVEHLEQALAKLSPEHREIVLLRFAEDLSYEEIAEQLDVSIGTVKSRINRARGELYKRMKKTL